MRVKNVRLLDGKHVVVIWKWYTARIWTKPFKPEKQPRHVPQQLPDDASAPKVIGFNMDMMARCRCPSRNGGRRSLHYVDEEIVRNLKGSGRASVRSTVAKATKSRWSERAEACAVPPAMSSITSVLSSADFSLRRQYRQGPGPVAARGVSTTAGPARSAISWPRRYHPSVRRGPRLPDDGETPREPYYGDENVTISISKRQSASNFAVTRAVKKTWRSSPPKTWAAARRHLRFQRYDLQFDQHGCPNAGVRRPAGHVRAVLFLGDWRDSLIVGSPSAIALVTLSHELMGFSLTFCTSAPGHRRRMMVDNSSSSSKDVSAQNPKSPRLEGILEGPRGGELGRRLHADHGSSLPGPIAFLKGMSGQLLDNLLHLVFSLIASLLSALT